MIEPRVGDLVGREDRIHRAFDGIGIGENRLGKSEPEATDVIRAEARGGVVRFERVEVEPVVDRLDHGADGPRGVLKEVPPARRTDSTTDPHANDPAAVHRPPRGS